MSQNQTICTQPQPPASAMAAESDSAGHMADGARRHFSWSAQLLAHARGAAIGAPVLVGRAVSTLPNGLLWQLGPAGLVWCGACNAGYR